MERVVSEFVGKANNPNLVHVPARDVSVQVRSQSHDMPSDHGIQVLNGGLDRFGGRNGGCVIDRGEEIGGDGRLDSGKISGPDKGGDGGKASVGSLEDGNGDGVLDGQGKMKLLCSFGGRILPRPRDGKLRYVGGETRVVTVGKSCTFLELARKMRAMCKADHQIKYQLPGEDFDALISVSSEEDFQNMVEEYYGLEKAGGLQKLRVFLVSSCESEIFDLRDGQQDPELHYVVAVNGILDSRSKKVSNGFNDLPDDLASLRAEGADEVLSQTRPHFDLQTRCFSTYSLANAPVLGNVSDCGNANKYFHDDKFFIDGTSNEGCPSCMEHTSGNCGLPEANNYHQQGEHGKAHFADGMDAELLIHPQGVHFLDQKPCGELDSSALTRVVSDIDILSLPRQPLLRGRLFHSDKCLRQTEDLTSLLDSGDSNSTYHVMPHVLSDTQLQDHSGTCLFDLYEEAMAHFALSDAPSAPYTNANASIEHVVEHMDNPRTDDFRSQTKASNFAEDQEFKIDGNCFGQNGVNYGTGHKYLQTNGLSNLQSQSHFNIPVITAGILIKPDEEGKQQDNNINKVSSSCIDSHVIDISGCDTLSQKVEVSESMASVPSVSAGVYSNFLSDASQGIQNNRLSIFHPEINQRTVKDKPYGVAEIISCEAEKLTGNIFDYLPHLSVPYSEVLNTKNDVGFAESRFCNDLMTNASPGLLSAMPSDTQDKEVARVENILKVDSPISPVEEKLDLDFNGSENNASSFYNKEAHNGTLRQKESLLDQTPIMIISPDDGDLGQGGFSTELYKRNNGAPIQERLKGDPFGIQLLKSVVVEDVTDNLPSGIHHMTHTAPYVHYETVQGAEYLDVSSPNAIGSENSLSDSGSEVTVLITQFTFCSIYDLLFWPSLFICYIYSATLTNSPFRMLNMSLLMWMDQSVMLQWLRWKLKYMVCR